MDHENEYSKTTEVPYELVLQSSVHTSMFHVIDSVTSSTNLFLKRIQHESKGIIRGFRGNGAVSFHDNETQITPLRRSTSDDVCKLEGNRFCCSNCALRLVPSQKK